MDAKRDMIRFKITLKGIRPPIWRRIEIPANYSFWDFHVAIQDAMGWTDSHLHAFSVRNLRGGIDQIGIPDDDSFEGDPMFLPGWKFQVSDYLFRPGTRAKYAYDFGDGWEHDLIVEAIGPREKGVTYPRCTAGKRRCPPEDCGGIYGYADLLEIIANPEHEEHASMMEWVGGPFNPNEFDPSAVHFEDPAWRWKVAFS